MEFLFEHLDAALVLALLWYGLKTRDSRLNDHADRLREAEKELFHAVEYIKDRRARDKQLWECLNTIKQDLATMKSDVQHLKERE